MAVFDRPYIKIIGCCYCNSSVILFNGRGSYYLLNIRVVFPDPSFDFPFIHITLHVVQGNHTINDEERISRIGTKHPGNNPTDMEQKNIWIKRIDKPFCYPFIGKWTICLCPISIVYYDKHMKDNRKRRPCQ